MGAPRSKGVSGPRGKLRSSKVLRIVGAVPGDALLRNMVLAGVPQGAGVRPRGKIDFDASPPEIPVLNLHDAARAGPGMRLRARRARPTQGLRGQS